GEVIDEQAKAAYRLRLSELRETMARAEAIGDIERAESAEREIAGLTRELSRAVGLRGRNRRAASASERARQTVTKTIRSALARIAQHDPDFGALLDGSIKTGTFCSYEPDPERPIAWEFAAADQIATLEPERRSRAVAAPDDDAHAAPPMLAAAPSSIAQRPPCVVRDGERDAIRAVFDAALSGRGSMVLIGGEAGARKSPLAVEEAQGGGQRGLRVF